MKKNLASSKKSLKPKAININKQPTITKGNKFSNHKGLVRVCDPCQSINKKTKIKFGVDALTSDKLKINSIGNKEFSKIGYNLLCKKEHSFSGLHWFEDGEFMKILWKADLKNNAIIITDVTEFGKGGEMNQTNLNKHDVQIIQTMIDTSVQTAVDPIDKRLTTLETDVNTLKTDVNTLKTDVNTLKTDVSDLKKDIKRLDDKIDTRFDSLESQLKAFMASFNKPVYIPSTNQGTTNQGTTNQGTTNQGTTNQGTKVKVIKKIK